MPEQQIFKRFPEHPSDSLPAIVAELYSAQQQSWEALRNGVDALAGVRMREIDCGDFSVRVQFNPKRIVSSGAKVDTASIKARKCFLCRENLPTEQKGVLYRDTFLVLCNPMPIFRQHFTDATLG